MTYKNESVCTQCSENYWLVGTADVANNNTIAEGYYCLKKDENLNCKTAYFTGLKFNCKECTNGLYKLVDNELT